MQYIIMHCGAKIYCMYAHVVVSLSLRLLDILETANTISLSILPLSDMIKIKQTMLNNGANTTCRRVMQLSSEMLLAALIRHEYI